jgi:hypothetical protein
VTTLVWRIIMTYPTNNLRDREAFSAGAWDYSIFNDLFPRPGMRFSDVDGRVEGNGYFLELEFKPTGKPIEGGQLKAYERRIRDDRTWVIYVWGPDGAPVQCQVLGVDPVPAPCDLESLRALVGAWIAWAESQPWAETLNRDHLFGRANVDKARSLSAAGVGR